MAPEVLSGHIHYLTSDQASRASENQLCLWLELCGSIELHSQLRSGRLDFAACVAPWMRLTDSLPDAPPVPADGLEVNELDEVFTFVGEKKTKSTS